MENIALEDMVKQIFVQCLNDSEILDLFKDRLGCNLCKQEYKKTQQEEKKHLDENSNLKKINKEQEQEIKSLKYKYSVCEEIISIWNELKQLNIEDRQYINELAGGDSLLSILSLGRDEGKIEQLWFFLRDIAVKENVSGGEVSILNDYFEFCIKVYNSTKNNEEEKYVCSQVSTGDDFDVDKTIKTADSRQIGTIKEVIVKGYIYKKRIKYKTIVRVG